MLEQQYKFNDVAMQCKEKNSNSFRLLQFYQLFLLMMTDDDIHWCFEIHLLSESVSVCCKNP